MDLYKRRRNTNNSTSSNSSHKTHRFDNNNSNSSSSSNGGAAYNLEYCTSTSSISPFETVAISCPSSSAKTVVSVAIDDVIISSSNDSSTSVTTTVRCSIQQNATNLKRRRSSISLDDMDHPELGFKPPSAKRQQRQSSLYESDPDSVVSSVYPSPVNELVSSSDCLTPGSEYNTAQADIPDSPNSLLERVSNHGEDVNDLVDDEEIVSDTTNSPSDCSSLGSYVTIQTYTPHNGECTPGQFYKSNASSSQTPSSVQKKVKSFEDYGCLTPAAEPELVRQCPLPALSWANAQDVWQRMCSKDKHAACLRDASMLEHHPGLQPRMRAILLDWLIEVCEVYKLHRETYYLAVDYLDRYLSAQKKVQKTHLQLIGITCLFVAAKVEEIYPPKIGEFAYVTDGACQESDILQHEILLLQALQWNINPVTPMGWLGIYMQLNVNNRTPASFQNFNVVSKKYASEVDDAFIFPQFSGLEFVQTAQLLDLCSLDVGTANFSYSVIAAAAMSHTFNREIALRCSGFDWKTLEPCALWMEPFFRIISEESEHVHLLEQNEQVPSKYGLGHVCPNIVTDESHIIQTHTTTLDMFDRACLLQAQYLTMSKFKEHASPATGLICHEGILTPPASSTKLLDANIEDEEDDDNEEDSGNSHSHDVTNSTLTATESDDCANVTVDNSTESSGKYGDSVDGGRESDNVSIN